jgi:hypothetical protein
VIKIDAAAGWPLLCRQRCSRPAFTLACTLVDFLRALATPEPILLADDDQGTV